MQAKNCCSITGVVWILRQADLLSLHSCQSLSLGWWLFRSFMSRFLPLMSRCRIRVPSRSFSVANENICSRSCCSTSSLERGTFRLSQLLWPAMRLLCQCEVVGNHICLAHSILHQHQTDDPSHHNRQSFHLENNQHYFWINFDKNVSKDAFFGSKENSYQNEPCRLGQAKNLYLSI